MAAWAGFQPGSWVDKIDVKDFIQKNYCPYDGDSSFLSGPSDKTSSLWKKCQELLRAEYRRGGVLEVDARIPITITSHPPAYIDRELETIVGLQTDQPLKRAINVLGGLNTSIKACQAYGYEPDAQLVDFFRKYRPTHNDGVFAVYTPEMKLARRVGIITGLPDSYGRGRIIGDYRRVPLYGIDHLAAGKENDLRSMSKTMDAPSIQLREEIFKQIEALHQIKAMAAGYGFDISRPANNAVEAVQWLYFAYLAAVKEQNGAAMSLGRIANFLDIYLERDIEQGSIGEMDAQELVDQLVIKLRLVRHLRSPEYNELFAGDPNWVTESLGGMGADGRHLVTRTSYRMLNSLYNLGAAPEPNMTILWSENLPDNFKRFCSELSINTSTLQYENDDVMRRYYGDDYAIACCVSAMKVGRETQFFGARCNLAKLLLYAINGGRDEITGEQVGVETPVYEGSILEYDKVMRRLKIQMEWLCELYVNTMNVIHYMHDKYAYEASQFALHDSMIHYYMAFGIAGLSVAADSLSAIKYARVKALKDARGIITDFSIEGEFPKFGNDEVMVDRIAAALVEDFGNHLKQYPTYKNAYHTLSILTITSNVMYGHHTGTTPDGRVAGQPLAPGANPLHGREEHGALAALNSVAQLDYHHARDGISFTFSTVPSALGTSREEQISNLTGLLSGYFKQDAHHMNVNVLNLETLKEAMEHPEKYPDLTIRISGYAVHFIKLTREQQEEVIMRTFFNRM
ncbi:pyruvate formate-lyase [hydrocarbon metagenome]|uniref:formate C-acetyltransferase n=1 Tax=hydrocarbon metagenome TaxID=938273 RepID=A0A0W8EA41_9ZZZZ